MPISSKAGNEGCSHVLQKVCDLFIGLKKRDERIRCVGGSTEMWMAQTRLRKGAAYFNPFRQAGFWNPNIVV